MNIVEKRRRELGLTQKQLAEKSGVKQSAISDIENGTTLNPRLDTVLKLAFVLHLDVYDLDLRRQYPERVTA